MADKKEPEFTVTDRRRFTSEGETTKERDQTPAEPSREPPQVHREAKEARPPETAKPAPEAVPPAPSAAERAAQQAAFEASSKELDAQLRSELGGRSAKDFEMTFERFVASLYMSALLQMGLMHEQGGTPQVDLLGARQTIDTLAILAQKTKGNLTGNEENLLQNCLYELRMAYVEVTNALARPPQPGAPPEKK